MVPVPTYLFGDRVGAPSNSRFTNIVERAVNRGRRTAVTRDMIKVP